jgi:ATP-dependent helicase/nuclease subunit B
VLERFGRAWPQQLPPDPAAILTGIGAEVFGPLMGEADVQGFWWPRFCRLVPEIVSWEQRRRRTARRVGVELRAESAIALADDSTVTLSGRADRIEVLEDGRLAIIDFKTGQVPTARQQKAGLAPQLPLEAALAALAPFSPAPDRRASEAALGPASAAEAIHVALKPGLGDEPSSKRGAETDLGAEAARHLDGFRAMVLQFRTGARGFTSRFAPEHQRHDGDFDRLARVKEWSSTGEDSDA